MTGLETLASWLAGLRPTDVPDRLHRLARLRILDTLGLIAVGAAHTAGRSTAQWSTTEPRFAGGATNLATGETCAAATAALVHATLAHARDFDDTFADSVVHPGSTVIPTALAIAQAHDLPFEQIITAITAGYEIAARLGRAAGRGFHARGFHATSVVGPIAAAATAGRLIGLDAERLADAMALATSMSSGTMAFLADGGWSKWLHTGWSAHGGIVAAGLAANGFRGPRHALEHSQGLYGAFLGHVPDSAPITHDLGRDWAGETAQFKLYPCAHVIHPYIEAALEFRGRSGLAPDQLRNLTGTIPPWATPIVAEPRAAKITPRNDLEAIASLPFMVAAALCDGHVSLATLGADRLARRDILDLAARIDCRADAALAVGFDGRIEIVLADGDHRQLAATLPDAASDRVRAKFHSNAALGCMTHASEIETALLDGTIGVRELMARAMRAPTSPPR